MGFLNSLGDPFQAMLSGASPGFAGGMFGGNQPMIEGMGGLEQALAQNKAMAPQRPTPQKQKLGIGDIIGLIGDAARGWKGQEPVYGPMMVERRKQQQRSDALSNFLDDPEGAIRALMAIDPAAAIQLHQSRQGKVPEEAALLQYAGIDPRSPEGQAIIKHKLLGAGQSDPTFVRELEALGIDPGSEEARELYYGRNSPAGYLLKPRGRSQGAPSGGPQPGQVVNGYRFKGGNPNDQNAWEAVGGPTVRPSGTFPPTGN